MFKPIILQHKHLNDRLYPLLMKRPRGRAVNAPDFGSRGRGFESRWKRDSSRTKRRFIAQSLSCSPFHRLEMTETLLKGRKTLTHPSINPLINLNYFVREIGIMISVICIPVIH